MKKSLLAFSLSLLMLMNIFSADVFCAADENSAVKSKRDMVLWYKQPGDNWLDGLPIGNGYMGAMVFGRVNDERIALNESTFWSGRPHDYTNPDGYKFYPQIRDLVFAGKYKEAEKMTDEHFYGIPPNQQAYQPIGDLLLKFKSSGTINDYYRELDMETGIAKVTYKDGDAEFYKGNFHVVSRSYYGCSSHM